MPLTKVGREVMVWAVPGLAILLLSLVAASGNLGIYAPKKGDSARGLNLDSSSGLNRGAAEVTITEDMTDGKPFTTLRELTARFALDPGSLSCSVRETEQFFDSDLRPEVVNLHADKNRKIGDVVTLCLD